ncbi:RHS repeat-associated core domain-containing protein, partial [Verrucomicrobium sp. BvORR106]|uniref:RHS repeat-associated core domain-containing protein n=1 Tax=Verrucomicrobium sp. BvORR106 TaxID=1403819 RepID=UPI00057089D6
AGNRATQTLTVTGQSAQTTTYHWDAENRLEGVTLPNADEHDYGYDYRTRRISRVENGIGTAIVFSGGLSVAEYESQGITPTVEYLRGPDMGGGVGGMMYSLRNGGTEAKYAMSNGRGDVVAQSNDAGALTWTASYEAYGKRPVETGTNLDRQRANTKEEDPTGLLNEGFRYRDIETGVWLSRDPAGFVDGPNLYAYVRQNPWTAWDPEGLAEYDNSWLQVGGMGKENGKILPVAGAGYASGRGYVDAFGNKHRSFCMSCHDNTPEARRNLGYSIDANAGDWRAFGIAASLNIAMFAATEVVALRTAVSEGRAALTTTAKAAAAEAELTSAKAATEVAKTVLPVEATPGSTTQGTRAFYMGQEGRKAAEKVGHQVLRVSPELLEQAGSDNNAALVQACINWAKGASGKVPVYVSKAGQAGKAGEYFWKHELPILLQKANKGEVSIKYIFPGKSS